VAETLQPERSPDQPVVWDKGVLRFKQNRIVRLLLDTGKLNLNDLSRMEFEQEDWEQFYQLIGYSLGGYDELSMVSDAAKDRAETERRRLVSVLPHDSKEK
jgi:hypothetical protein